MNTNNKVIYIAIPYYGDEISGDPIFIEKEDIIDCLDSTESIIYKIDIQNRTIEKIEDVEEEDYE